MIAGLGGRPSTNVDVPITSIFLVLFLCGAIAHMTIFQLNRRKGHKFLMSGMMFGFCMMRVVTCIMRIVWACRITNVRIAIAAQILVAAGVILIFAINLVFAQRILRSAHKHSLWHPVMNHAFTAIFIIVAISLLMLIVAVVQSFYTLNSNTRRIDRDIQLYGATYFAVVAFLPIPLTVFGLLIPHHGKLENFGSGRYRTKVAILLTATFFLSFGAWFRAGTAYKKPRPAYNPAWYHHKACFYFFDLGVELIVIWLYILVRVDRRFHVPDGSKKAGNYHPGQKEADQANEMGKVPSGGGMVTRIMTEEEVFDDEDPDDVQALPPVRGLGASRSTVQIPLQTL